MDSKHAHCPSCNSVQRFAPIPRTEGNVVRIHIVCNACGLDMIIDQFTLTRYKDQQRNHRRRMLLRRAAAKRSRLRRT